MEIEMLELFKFEFVWKYKPNVNVFFIYSDRDGHVDSMQINKVIADIRGI